eukprot:Phypoly_transcript_00701.p1 GENE.Phypoly_transcript_00701~~Phypoly_transcript_00701.p1  ORF type:complete len:768 (+),score=130.03 Phypoly_transcript_00701:204-2507(+)
MTDSTPSPSMLLTWSQEQTRGYRGVDITDFSASWKDGLALCALIHSMDKSQFQYEPLLYLSKEEVLRTGFEYASKIGIPQLLGTSDFLVPAPDHTAVESYLLSIYHHWQLHQQREEKALAQRLLAQHKEDHEANREISFLAEKNVNVGKMLRESRQIKGLLVTVEEELSQIVSSIELNGFQNELVRNEISDKTVELENTVEKERQQYDTEIEQLQKELDDLKKKGPSDQQLALKRRLDEQCEKKDRLTRIKQQMEQEIQQLKLQLEQDEQQRIQLQARRAQAEQRRNDLRLKHKDELQRLQRDLLESFNTEDKLHTDLTQQNYVKSSLQTETNKLNTEVRNLDGIHTGIVKQNTELKEKKQKLEQQLLGAKLYLEEETRILNFKELSQSDLKQHKKAKTEELERSYEVKRLKEKEHRKIAGELAGTKDVYDKEYLHIKTIKRDLSKLEIRGDILKSENDDEVQKRPKKLQQIKETARSRIEKEDSKHRLKVEAVASQLAALSANSQEAQHVLKADKTKIDEIRARTDELSTETRSIVSSLTTEATSQREASRAQDNLKRELQLANDFLVSDKNNKLKTARAKHRAEDNLKYITEVAALADSKKGALESTKDHLARDYELTKQDLKLAEKEVKKAREHKQKLNEEKEKLRQDTKQTFAEFTSAQNQSNNITREYEIDSASNIQRSGKDTAIMHTKTEVLKRETAFLTEDNATLQLAHVQAKTIKESDKCTLEQDRKTLKKLQDHRAELQIGTATEDSCNTKWSVFLFF